MKSRDYSLLIKLLESGKMVRGITKNGEYLDMSYDNGKYCYKVIDRTKTFCWDKKFFMRWMWIWEVTFYTH